MQKALFLDRDGVVNIDYGYVHKQQDFVFVPGIFDLVRMAQENDYRVIVVTNQGGIGLGYYTEDDFRSLTTWMVSKFEDEGCKIDEVYFSANHPRGVVEGLIGDSEFRKPRPGMLLKAKSEFDLNMDRCLMVGDKLTDMQAAENAGIETRFLFSPEETPETSDYPACYIVKSLNLISAHLKN
jgi:D-glycero-D-manno-heptose 1,7-bisphosphate phosphatase